CGGGQCQDDCTVQICLPPCVGVVTTGTCDGDGCAPTGCCQGAFRDTPFCIETDAAACEFGNGTFFPGVTCDSTTGECRVPSPTPSQTPTSTPTQTATPTPTATRTATHTRVPQTAPSTHTPQSPPTL